MRGWVLSFLWVFVLLLGASFQASAIDSAPEPRQTCAQFLLLQVKKIWDFANRKSVISHSHQSLMLGVPPGISLHNRDMLTYHVLDLFEHPLPLAWIRTLDWSLRRRFGNLEALNEFQSLIGSDISTLWTEIPHPRAKNRVSVAVEVTSEFGQTVVLLFDEHPLDGMQYYVCSDIYVIPPSGQPGSDQTL